MSIAEKIQQIAENEQKVYEAGLNFGKKECDQKHFTTEFYGNGKTSITFNVPFEPDEILLFSYDPTILLAGQKAVLFQCDLRAFGIGAGFLATRAAAAGNTVYNALITTTSYLSRYSREESGEITISNITTTNGVTGVFGTDVKYKVVATKYTTQTDKERITEFVNNLPNTGGSITINRAKKEKSFTEEEWQALIAPKKEQNWSFALFG